MTNLKEVLEKSDERIDLIWSRAHIPDYANDAKIAVKSLLAESHRAVIASVIEEMEEILEWPEPQKGAGESIGPLAGVGMYMQYDADRKKHREQILDLITRLGEI